MNLLRSFPSSLTYLKQKKAGKNPVFKAKNIGLKTKTDFWN